MKLNKNQLKYWTTYENEVVINDVINISREEREKIRVLEFPSKIDGKKIENIIMFLDPDKWPSLKKIILPKHLKNTYASSDLEFNFHLEYRD